jgi:hypothetical protein
MRHQRQPEFRYLYSLSGYRFCDLLLSQGQVAEVVQRASQTLEYEKESWYSLLSIALDKLSLGRAHLLLALSNIKGRVLSAAEGLSPAEDFLNQAVTGLRQSGDQDVLARALIDRAALYRVQGEFAKAWADLDEAHEIAERGGMGIHLADYHLEACRLEIKEQKANGKKQAEEHLRIAAKMIEDMGYGRRRPEVEELRKQLES